MADTEIASFGKKKKKKVNFELEEEGAAPTSVTEEANAESTPKGEEEEDLEAMFATKKKKKKKKDVVEGEEEKEGGEEEEEDAFKEKKKKKKKRDVGFMDAELQEGAPASQEQGEEGVGSGEEDEGAGAEKEEEEEDKKGFKSLFTEGNEPWLTNPSRDYTYPELLTRFYHILIRHNPELGTGERRRYTIVPPSVHREGSKKTVFANVSEIAKRMNRNPEHVIQFLFTELGTQGSVDAEERLVIRGRFQPKQIENVLRRYIIEYVTCKTCKSPNTVLVKQNRLFFMQCDSCGSTRSVAAIKSGFMAQVGRRAKKPE